jgi:hypothetical protein
MNFCTGLKKMNVWILKTNISSQSEFEKVKNTFDRNLDIYECTIDLDDIDKVVRIISNDLTMDEAESKIQNLGFFCKELDD